MDDNSVKLKKASIKSSIILWLFLGCFLVFAMVIIGGITRLTGSGLSITEWKVVTGTIPPLNESQWNEAFDKYKEIPQYKEMNSGFSLSDFKFIYFWEYFHRLTGRMIGIVFLIGFFYFYIKKAIDKPLMKKLLIMFLLGAIQGFLGWYMVSSGLTENVRVSHIRLAVHLTFAFITFGYIFWVALTQLFSVELSPTKNISRYRNISNALLGIIILQVIYGAFVAGTKAGWFYATWPKMEGEWVPESVGFAFSKDGISSLWNNLATVQFIHRCLAYIIAATIGLLVWKTGKDIQLSYSQKQAASMLLTLVLVQVGLGILTLLSGVPIWMGVTHQVVAFFLFGSTIYFIHRLKYS